MRILYLAPGAKARQAAYEASVISYQVLYVTHYLLLRRNMDRNAFR